MATQQELEAAIAGDPDDVAPYLVYADWLQAAGDPRGELIVLQHRQATAPADERAAIDAAIAAHFAAHPDLVGPFSPNPATANYREKAFAFTWRRGFVESVDLVWPMYGYDVEKATEEVRAMLEHPSGRFITRMVVGPAPGDDQMNMECVNTVLVETGLPETLRELDWGRQGDWDISGTSTGRFGAVIARFPKLRTIRLSGGEVDLGSGAPLELPACESLIVESGSLDAASFARIAAARMPNVRHLEIWFGTKNYGASCTTKDLAALLDRTDLPALRSLGIRNCPFVDDVIPMLASSPLLAKLARLDLSMGALSDEGLARLVVHQDAFRHLEHIDVDDNALSGAAAPILAAYTPAMTFGEQDPERADPDTDIEDRWTSVGE